MSVTTQTTYEAMFATSNDAKEFEDSALSAGREYLPPCALAVLDRGKATPAYWAWLVSQVEEARAV